jgi:hypothetical protein
MSALLRRLPWAAAIALLPLPALAHIKWFASYDLMSPPRTIAIVTTSSGFMALLMLAAVVLAGVSVADNRLLAWRGGWLQQWMERVEAGVQSRTYLILRLLIAAVFVVLARDGRTILTPELQASTPCVADIQWVIAATALVPATGSIAGCGILMLYGMAIEKYGLFHLMDYPAFIGAALYLIWMSRGPEQEVKAMAMLRAATAVTLMVGATEKFCYPTWSFPLLKEVPALTFGVADLDFFMMAAGFVEFALAYLVLFGRVSGQVAAGVLFTLMAAAIVQFGKVDAIGHALFLAALLTLTLRKNHLSHALHRVTAGSAPWAAAAASAVLFVALSLGFIKFYHWSYNELTICSVSKTGDHLHR